MLWPWSSPAPLICLRGPRVILRLPQMSDYEAWYVLRHSSRDFLRPFEPRWTDADLGRRVFATRVRRAREEAEEGTDYSFFIFLNGGPRDTLVGGITLSNIRRRAAQFVNLGYWMGQPYAGQGLMTDALRATLPFVFDDLRLHRLEAACLPHNEPSKGVLTKVGFHEEGLARQYLRINGQWADHLLFALLRADYDALLRAPR